MSNVAARFVVSPSSPIETKFEVNVQSNDHNLLLNRDLPNQHPISAITGLQEALDSIPTDVVTEQELNTALAAKQDVLTAGANIQINNNVISATDTTYTAGTGIDITNGVISNTQTSAVWGNITGTLADQTDLNDALNNLSGGIDSNHQAISSINQTISTYGNIVTHNTSEFATASQGALADTAIQPNDNISELNNNVGYITGITSSDVTTALGYTPYDSSNPSGYTTNVGTVTSVNNVSPVNGNVTLSIPSAQVNSDWNASSGVAEILNKPSLATVATTGAYSDLSGTPTIPTVNNATLTITQGGVSKGTFTANASSDVTIALDAGGGSSYTAGTGIDITNNVISVDNTIAFKSDIPTDTSDLTNSAGYITSSALSGYQTTSNLVTSVSSSSTDSQYPSAKLFYDTCGDIETLINAL